MVEKRLAQAAARLGLSVRQVKRLAKRYRERGAAGMASGRRGKWPNSALAEGVRCAAMSLVGERYPDFGATFAAQKLSEEHGLAVSRVHAAGEGAGGAGEPDAAGPAGEGVAAARHRRHGGGERVPAGVPGGPQPALRGGAAGGGGRSPRGAARRGRAGADPERAPFAQADEEPDVRREHQ